RADIAPPGASATPGADQSVFRSRYRAKGPASVHPIKNKRFYIRLLLFVGPVDCGDRAFLPCFSRIRHCWGADRLTERGCQSRVLPAIPSLRKTPAFLFASLRRDWQVVGTK